ncbi:hypothetical protein ABTY98_22305 [Streptomyces sp. NPDC096040]|uniref:hypothetical protein n=1 Tax=Streptomyces sp. NPDC096040 TaxID=3155541 RepID=UPI003333A0D4
MSDSNYLIGTASWRVTFSRRCAETRLLSEEAEPNLHGEALQPLLDQIEGGAGAFRGVGGDAVDALALALGEPAVALVLLAVRLPRARARVAVPA